ncbi:alpha-1,2-fucosyltransferase [Rhodocytophaga aerolata]|uniref:Alpha-1,2-fucosyltransferase n=1 Tax=Rhodocytophaga aerolata TaxID=455078 RepID=A0ABT8RFZ2_9BACT|nr:alpha-1,2-fucosyltransferase [Rhodocytophaga aerolata]MDO1451023.1 alpha-1,2-fucosyltransferase [Rhodocytophaga aerolata]
MIIVRLNGGLGNQLFQYALGKHLAHLHKTQLKLDIRWFEKGIRNYELKYFNINETIATEEEISFTSNMTTSLINRFQRSIVEPLLPYYKRSIVEEKTNSFDRNIFKSKSDIYVKGYWQSEKYFVNIEEQIRRDFTFRYELDHKNKGLSDKIKVCNAVSVHIRRGDYVSDPEYAKKYGACSVDYYHRAYTLFEKKFEEPYYFIFSDDIQWVQERIKFFQPCVYINHNTGNNSYKDMQLMSLCKHNIIANSTFSWWGAWLNSNSEKIVVAPINWYHDTTIETKDLLPEGWCKL